MLSRVYLIIGLLLLGGYALLALTGRELGDPQRQRVPADVRNSPGGYRSFHTSIWYAGFRGGK